MTGMPESTPMPEDRHQWRVYAARRISRARDWNESTRRDLAQLGLSHEEGQTAICSGELPEWADEYTRKHVQRVLSLRRALRGHLRLLERLGHYPPPRAEEILLLEAARQIARGARVFAARADLTVALTSSGHPERMLPNTYEQDWWDVLRSRSEVLLYDYLRSLSRTDVPDLPPRTHTRKSERGSNSAVAAYGRTHRPVGAWRPAVLIPLWYFSCRHRSSGGNTSGTSAVARRARHSERDENANPTPSIRPRPRDRLCAEPVSRRRPTAICVFRRSFDTTGPDP